MDVIDILEKANKNIEELIRMYIDLVKTSESICDKITDYTNDCSRLICEECYEKYTKILSGELQIKYCLNEKDFEKGEVYLNGIYLGKCNNFEAKIEYKLEENKNEK